MIFVIWSQAARAVTKAAAELKTADFGLQRPAPTLTGGRGIVRGDIRRLKRPVIRTDAARHAHHHTTARAPRFSPDSFYCDGGQPGRRAVVRMLTADGPGCGSLRRPNPIFQSLKAVELPTIGCARCIVGVSVGERVPVIQRRGGDRPAGPELGETMRIFRRTSQTDASPRPQILAIEESFLTGGKPWL